MNNKVLSYLGFARKSGNLIIGQGTCQSAMNRCEIRALVLCEDLAENTKKKLIRLAECTGTEYRVFGHSDDLGQAAGARGSAVFGIKDENFSKTIINAIDNSQSE